jgi:DNA-binding LytR/AlgR family response regulator
MLKCIIVVDQVQTVQALKSHIRKIPFLELTGSFNDPKEALVFLKNKPADLVFFNMHRSPQADSTQIHIFQLHAMVVLISSNKSLAYDAFENNAVDFLLKPVQFERFFRAAEKAYRVKFPAESIKSTTEISHLKGGFIFIKEATRLIRLELDDIYYIMGLKNYVSIMTKSHRIVSLQTMKQMEELLPARRFMRVHRSYFVALDKIISVEKQQIHVKDKVIPIGHVYLPLFMKKIMKISNH